MAFKEVFKKHQGLTILSEVLQGWMKRWTSGRDVYINVDWDGHVVNPVLEVGSSAVASNLQSTSQIQKGRERGKCTRVDKGRVRFWRPGSWFPPVTSLLPISLAKIPKFFYREWVPIETNPSLQEHDWISKRNRQKLPKRKERPSFVSVPPPPINRYCHHTKCI